MENKKLSLSIIMSLAIAMQLVLYKIYGINIIGDSHAYLANAQSIGQSGALSDPHYLWYLGYILLLVPMVSFAFEPWTIILLQVIASLFGVFIFYHTVSIVVESKAIAFFATLFFIAWYEIFILNFFINTDALFVSLNLFLFYMVVKGLKKGVWEVLLFMGLLTWIFFVRPNGFVTAVAAFTAGVVYLYSNNRRLALRIAPFFVMALIPAGFFFLNRLLSGFEFVGQYATGEIVYGASTVSKNLNIQGLIISTPSLVLEKDLHPMLSLWHFILDNPFYFLKLFFLKIGYFLAHIKPYYSSWHNLWILFTLIPAYVLASIGFLSNRISPPIKIFAFLFVALNTLIMGFAVEDWDGRFLMPLLPVVFVLGACGLDNIITRNQYLLFKFFWN